MEQKVINSLALRIAQLELDNAFLGAQLELTREKNDELSKMLIKKEEEQDATGHDPVQGNNA